MVSPENVIALRHFMKLSTCRFLISGFSLIAPLALCGQLTEIRAAHNADSVFRTDFELAEGYLVGPVMLPGAWTLIGEGQAQIHTDAISGEQALGFTGDWLRFQGPDVGQNVAWLDLLVSPVFIETADLPHELAAGPQAFTEFIRFGEEGEVFVLHGDQQGGGDWRPAGNFDLSPGLPWLRLTLRIDSSSQTWDLWLNEELAAVDLGFAGQAGAAPSFAIRGHESELTYLDAVYAGPANPLFRDEDNDGLPTAYELARGLDPAISDRHRTIAQRYWIISIAGQSDRRAVPPTDPAPTQSPSAQGPPPVIAIQPGKPCWRNCSRCATKSARFTKTIVPSSRRRPGRNARWPRKHFETPPGPEPKTCRTSNGRFAAGTPSANG